MAPYDSWCKVLKRKVGAVDSDEINSKQAARLELGFLSAAQGLERPPKVRGQCSISIFDGCGCMSLALAMESIPTIRPWEIENHRSLDVVKNDLVLLQLAN